MSKRKKTNKNVAKNTDPYMRVPSETERIRKVKVQIEDILTKNKLALAPVVILTGDKVASRVDIVSTEPQKIS